MEINNILPDLIRKIQKYSGSYDTLDLIKGMDEQSIRTLEDQWEVVFPESLKSVLSYGGKTVLEPKYIGLIIAIPHYGEMTLTSEDQMIAVYDLLVKSGYQEKITTHDLGAIKEEYLWNSKWIPVAAYGGDSIHEEISLYDLIILDEESELYGKIVHWTYRSGVVRIVADSFADYIRNFYLAIDKLYWDETYGFSF